MFLTSAVYTTRCMGSTTNIFARHTYKNVGLIVLKLMSNLFVDPMRVPTALIPDGI